MAAQLTVKVDCAALLAALKDTPEAFSRQMKIAMTNSTADVQTYARQNHPSFKTHSGNAERSLTTAVSSTGLQGDVSVNQSSPGKYAMWLNDGSKYLLPGRFLESALKACSDKIVQRIEDGINRALKASRLK